MAKTMMSNAQRRGEQGSALVIAILVTVILALLGISFLLMGETESRIAKNENFAAQALYAAESGTRVVQSWFDKPGSGPDGALHYPDQYSYLRRNLRLILDESDPYNPSAADLTGGPTAAYPFYKRDTLDFFERPYRGSLGDAFLGMEEGPDVRIDKDDSTTSASVLLTNLSQTLFGEFPGSGLRTRISTIDVYAPPYIQVGGNWQRYGLATIKVIAQIYRDDGSDRVVAEREVQTVISEIPYRGPYAALQSCADLSFVCEPGKFTLHWGPIAAAAKLTVSGAPPDFIEIPQSLPRSIPPTPRVDPLWSTADPPTVTAFQTTFDGLAVEDPWLRVLAGDRIDNAPSGQQSVLPTTSDPVDRVSDHSNMIQDLPLVGCPLYDYQTWKRIANTGGADVAYYAYAGSGDLFKENGTGDARSFVEITNGAEGLFFFDTENGLPPEDVDGDGLFDNLTPGILIQGEPWNFRGFLYLNAESFQLDQVTGTARTLQPPGELFLDADGNDAYDLGESWINLAYPATLVSPVVLDASDSYGGLVMRNDRGPEIAGVPVAFQGILFTNGFFEATGTATFYGSVVARQGVTQAADDGSLPTPEFYWDASIGGDWPPAGWKVPRVVGTAWITER
jgi:hypothetical protein